MSIASFYRSVLLIPAMAALAACTSNGVDLKPAPSTAPDGGRADSNVVSTVHGVTMQVQVNQWSGDATVIDKITPLRVSVRNNSGDPVRISYDNFALVMDNGKRFSALPPLEVEGSVDRRVTRDVGAPRFEYRNFAVAPYAGNAYSGVSTYDSDYGFNSGYYQNYYNHWKTIDVRLPTDYMRKVAAPEGVLGPGGKLNGFLYFEKVPTSMIDHVQFRADLVNAETGEQLGEISIPFVTPTGSS